VSITIVNALLLALASQLSAVEIGAKAYMDDVKFLASPSLKGRATGSPELERAAKYIAKEFEKAKLQPLNGSSYLQPFDVSVDAELGSGNRFEYVFENTRHSLRLQQEFVPFSFSGTGKISAPVVFAGYGITAREYNYDDYAGIDVKGKAVLVLRHEPQEYDAKSVFAGRVYTEHSQLFSKAVNAKLHGAAAVIFITDTASHSNTDDALEKFGKSVSPSNPGIPFLHLKAEVAERWLEAAGRNLKSVQEEIDKDLRPRSFPLSDQLLVEGEVDVRRSLKTVHNVAGYLPGLTEEYVVVGAHYDHLGLGEQFSLAPSMAGKVHPGADDNASGTAAVLALARWFSNQPRLKRGIVFLAFAGEELGLLGSSYFVNHPALPLSQAVGMINMDMIGRVRDSKVYVGGTGTGTGLAELLEEVRKPYKLKLDVSEQGGYGSSDHTSFTTKQVPVLFFFSGLHGDYHKPSDTWEKIEADAAAQLVGLIGDLTERLASRPERSKYIRVEPKNPHAAGGSTGSSSGGYGPYFGSIPDFAEPPTGVRFADVRTGSPAEKAGLLAGDILVAFGGNKIQNLYDFTYALRSKKPGEEVAVEVLRGGKPHHAKVLLTERK